jgi:hypothetical protein
VAHGNYLAFVMKGMRQHVVQNECGAARRTHPALGHTQQFLIEFMFAQPVQLFECLRHDAALKFRGRFNRTVIVGTQLGHGQDLEAVHPGHLARNGMEHLITDVGARETRKFRHQKIGVHGAQVPAYPVRSGFPHGRILNLLW